MKLKKHFFGKLLSLLEKEGRQVIIEGRKRGGENVRV